MSRLPPQWQQLKNMKFKYSFIIAFMALTYGVSGQDLNPRLEGQVSFVTSQNIYVKFQDTRAIAIGDTLGLEVSDTACLVVKSKSTTSCVCEVLEGCTIQKGDKVFYQINSRKTGKIEKSPVKEITPVLVDLEVEPLYKENIQGSISATSYSSIAEKRDDRHRLMGRLAIQANHIRDSKFSFNTYLNYRHIFDQKDSTSFPNTDILRVYNLAVHYDATPTLSITLGRNINPKISSLGAMDGLQVEKYFGKTYIGAIAGFRPDILDYGFNANLLEYGGFFGFITEAKSFYSQTTLGFIEQQNDGEIDRRYVFFQHNSTIAKNLNLFSSLELDLYSKLNDEVNNEIRLTNFYISARYRFSRKFNMMISYDTRKRIIYYETYQSEVERLLDDDLARQGARVRINGRPFKNILMGASYSKRFQNNSLNKSDNIYGYLTFSKVPLINGRLSLSYNINESNYLKSNIASLRHSNSYFHGRLNADFYYRFVQYDYQNNLETLDQHYVGTNLSYNITRKLRVGLTAELAISPQENNYRIYSMIVQRF